MRLSVQTTQNVCLPCLLRYGRRTLSMTTAPVDKTPIKDISSAHLKHTRLRLHHRTRLLRTEPRRANSRNYSAPSAGRLELTESQRQEVEVLRELRQKLQRGVHSAPKLPAEARAGITIEEALKILPERPAGREVQYAATLEQLFAGRTLKDVREQLKGLVRHVGEGGRYVEEETSKKLLKELGVLSLQGSGDGEATEADLERPSPEKVAEGQASVASPPTVAKPKSGKTKQARKRVKGVAKMAKPERFREILAKGAGRGRHVLATQPPKTEKETSVPVLLTSSKSKAPKGKIAAATKDGNLVASLDGALLQSIAASDLSLKPLAIGEPNVPRLSFDLSRVLFNPGVYQLQDPRSKVYNFNPYLAQIMSVSDFNFSALNEYITSSRDAILRNIAKEHDKRYIGSSSSMSGALSHFHFLLSGWRSIHTPNLSRAFEVDSTNFTRLQRGPTAIFLKYKDGVYAVDADKEFDTANILMSLGKSMEKLLTLEKDDFERYRKSGNSDSDAQVKDTQPEQYHYGEIGQFLMRSQLDAYDPRLPGTGMFDLKTRAVSAVRMHLQNHEIGVGYQIKELFGSWESYEREYYDMIRSAFLKYSLQVRMGRMDGIFVAYHNIQRLFGFQYIPISELDLALHGQTDRTLGDQEFCLSVGLLNDIFDRATKEFPEQSLRIHFETREATDKRELTPYMYIFAEPVSEEEAQRIQNMKKDEIAAFEQRIFNPEVPPVPQPLAEAMGGAEAAEAAEAAEVTEDETAQPTPSMITVDLEGEDEAQLISVAPLNTQKTDATVVNSATDATPTHQSNAANVEFLDSLNEMSLEPTKDKAKRELSPLLGLKLVIRNRVNNELVPRPQNLTESDDWKVEYNVIEMAPERAWSNYILCKNRRAVALSYDKDDEKSVSRYILNLREMSRKGAEWRQRQDELESQREKVLLYPDSPGR